MIQVRAYYLSGWNSVTCRRTKLCSIFAAMETYQAERERYELLFRKESKLYNILSASRLACVLLAGIAAYEVYQTGHALFGAALFICIVAFLVFVRRHIRVGRQRKFYQQLIRINEQEIAALNGDLSSFAAGEQYVDPQHAYTFDLDIFGANSIFQYCNRTANTIGSDRLARYFLKDQTKAEIYETQDALRELSAQLQWRQGFLATGQLDPDQKSAYRLLLQWADLPVEQTNIALRILWYVVPIATLGTGLAALLAPESGLFDTFKYLTLANLAIVSGHAKQIKAELRYLNAIFKVVEQYGYLLRYIEQGRFRPEKLRRLQEGLNTTGKPASQAILDLAALMHQLESVQNLIGAILFNSLLLYHLHILLALERWKNRHRAQIKLWLGTIAELEALSSLAHFAYNNPDFVFPEIADTPGLNMTQLGHPLIPEAKRVCNDIQWKKAGFVILTGSNMSGKSTFLRTIGINLLLAKMGAPVCAKTCTTFPFDIFVCMKLSDSLHDNESYFYAELKRLKRIIDHLESGAPGFILLDEVLRGTNSNDKLSGTLGLLETMVRLKSTGLLATHDLNVCELQHKYPDVLRNMCFEVEMTENDLHFDYRLRDGVCVNKSASFLMKKMGVIG